MKGLLLKDWICIQKIYAKVLVMIVAFYVLLTIFSKGSPSSVGMMVAMLVMLFSTLPVATFTVDKTSHWDRYALSGPIDRSSAVLAKYLLSWILIAMGSFVSFLFMVSVSLLRGEFNARELAEEVKLLFIFLEAGVLLNSLLTPCIFRFGAERARTILFILVGIPFLLTLIFESLHLPVPDAGLLRWLQIFAPVLAALAAYLSYRVSLHLFQKKDID